MDLAFHNKRREHARSIQAGCVGVLTWRSINPPAASDVSAVAPTVNKFTESHDDCCNSVFAGAPKVATNKLQRALNAAARVMVTGRRKFHCRLS